MRIQFSSFRVRLDVSENILKDLFQALSRGTISLTKQHEIIQKREMAKFSRFATRLVLENITISFNFHQSGKILLHYNKQEREDGVALCRPPSSCEIPTSSINSNREGCSR